MFKLIQITPFSDTKHLKEILDLLLKNKSFIFFNDYENVETDFWNDLYSKNSVVIGAVKNNSIFAVLILKKFEKISADKFFCYMSGGADRGVAIELEQSLAYIFSDLKRHGVIAVRLETLSSNRPMRNMASRLNFRKVGEIKAAGMRKNKLLSSILYEKVL
jgi:hypothetical protein